MRRQDYLFHKFELDNALMNQHAKLAKRIEGFSVETLTSESLPKVMDELYYEFCVHPIELLEGAVSAAAEETDIDVSQDRMRAIHDRSKPFYVKGVTVSYYVPFSGDKDLFFAKPNTFNFNPPRAVISENEIIISSRVIGTDVSKTKSYYEKQLSGIKQYLDWQKGVIESFNNGLKSQINEKLNSRLRHLQETQLSLSNLGLPIRNQSKTSVSSISGKTNDSKKSIIKSENNVFYDVSLSFAGEDRDYVQKCAELLKSSGIKVFYDLYEKGSLWGKNLIDHLSDIYRNRSRYVVMFISEYYVKKAWPKHERQHAQSRALLTNESYILPARFDDSEVPGMASTVSYIDLRTTSPDELVKLVIEKVKVK